MMHDAEQTPDSKLREARRRKYIEAIKRAEEAARVDPAGHQRKVVLFAMFGYLFLVLPLLVLLGITALLVRYFLNSNSDLSVWAAIGAIVTGFLSYGWLISLWVRVPRPEGIRVRRRSAPGLYELIDTIRAEVRLPRLSGVYLTADTNASLYTRPMFLGLFGPGRHTLILGAVLLAGISPEHAKALLAHEFSHQRKGDSRAATWGTRVRVAWARLAQRGNVLVNPILNWFAPRLDAMTFASAREAEYEADAFSASMSDTQTAGQALLRFTLVGMYFEAVYLHAHQATAGRVAKPTEDFFREAVSRLRSGDADSAGRQQLARALRDKTSYEDTHPCLRDRLTGIGYAPAVEAIDPTALSCPPQPGLDALGALFDPRFVEASLVKFDREFAMFMAEAWAARHEMVKKSSAALGGEGAASAPAVSESEISGCSDVEALMETGVMIIETQSVLEAMPWIERVLEINPEHAQANAIVAKELLDADDASGIELAERAIGRDPRCYISLSDSLYTYYRGQGMIEEAEQLQVRLQVFEEQLHHAMLERTTLSSAKQIVPHDLSDMETARLSEDLAGCPAVEQAHLFRMRGLKHMSDVPGYLLAIKFRLGLLTLSEQRATAKLADEVGNALRSDKWIVVYAPRMTPWLKRPCKKHPSAEIFRRE